MAFALRYSSLSKKQLYTIIMETSVSEKKSLFSDTAPTVHRSFIINETEDIIYLPMGLWKKYSTPVEKGKLPLHPNGTPDDFPKMNKKAKFIKELLTPETDPSGKKRDQVSIVTEAMKQLQEDSYVFLDVHTGCGKTAMSIYMSVKLGLKTMIMCPLNTVKDQWGPEYTKYTGNSVKIQYINGAKCKLDETADVYVIGPIKASKMTHEDFEDIGTLIIDEAHLSASLTFTVSALMFRCRYVIGLTATMDRPDGLEKIYSHYFGDSKNYIHKTEVKIMTVHKYNTQFKPTIEYVMRGGKSVPDWAVVINSLDYNIERQKLIADICVSYPKETIAIFCDRKLFVEGLYKILKEMGESVDYMHGGKGKIDDSVRILVIGRKKGGVGFNKADLTMGIIASDTKDVRQIEGRVRMDDCKIIHLVDDHPTLERHWEVCRKWYTQRGATFIYEGMEGRKGGERKKGEKLPLKRMLHPIK